jgi:dolichol-phosphate mannosyltransferase
MALSPVSKPSSASATAPVGLDLSIVVPTFNERGNVERLIAALEIALQGIAWQVIFVDDDSPDGTAAAVKAIAATDSRVQCLHRVGRRGLAGAVIEGAMASAAPFVAVIDGDMQHDETLLPAMFAALRADRADLVIGSRFLQADGLDKGLSAIRQMGSRVAAWLGRKALRAEVSDPVSGFFMIRRTLIEQVAQKLSTDGFKVLFDIIASQATPPRILELSYAFREREAGESKLDSRVVVEYAGLVLGKLTNDLLSVRTVLFGLVGASGILVHLSVLYLLELGGHNSFAQAQIIAALVAMTSNYFINNALTYRDRRHKGWRLVSGYLQFCLVCSVGLAANFAVADLVRTYVPGWIAAGTAGAAVGAIWNYVISTITVW